MHSSVSLANKTNVVKALVDITKNLETYGDITGDNLVSSNLCSMSKHFCMSTHLSWAFGPGMLYWKW